MAGAWLDLVRNENNFYGLCAGNLISSGTALSSGGSLRGGA